MAGSSAASLHRLAALLILVGVCGLVYFTAAHLFGILRLQDIKQYIVRRKPPLVVQNETEEQ